MKPARISEDKLLKQFKKGDRDALSQVYNMWFPELCYFAYRITDHLGEAEDIAAATLQLLLSRHDQFEGLMNIRAFLFVTVRNKCLDYLRFVERQKASHKELYAIKGEGEAEHYILSEIIQGEVIKELLEEVERLPLQRKEVIKLYFMEGLTVSDIAAKLKISPNAVSMTKSRALDQLRNVISNKRLLPISGMILVFKQLYTCLDSFFHS